MKRAATIILLFASACLAKDEAPMFARQEEAKEVAADAPGAPPPMPAAEPAAMPRKKAAPMRARGGGAVGGLAAMADASSFTAELERDEGGAKGEANAAEASAPSRAWFPETFLFEPLVKTDANGGATVPVRVPDRLTTWRILALAHSRDGAQAGTEASFLGTLPTYVDPVVPSFLMSGDEVSIPVQIVNTTDAPVTRTLKVEAKGAGLGRGAGPVLIAAGSSKVEYVPLRANKPGTVVFRASLGDADAVEKTIPVLPVGRPLSEQRGGTLAAPRKLELALPADADVDSTSARLLVFPGALAILRAELGAASSRGGLEADAYALLLAGKGEQLLRALGGEPDSKGLRHLAIVAGQRAIRAARSPDVITAALFTEPALAHPDNAVLSRLGERLADTVAQTQRPDGTCAGASGWTLQRLLVTTAECVRAVRAGTSTSRGKQRAQGALLRANGAFERNLGRVEDGYTAAAIVASGAVEGSIADKLRARVREAVRENKDGTRALPVDSGVVRADGLTPSEIEATALAVLALINDQEAQKIIPDLGARLLAAYDPRFGWGDGRTNLAALTAVLALFKDPLPSRVEITLELDGRKVAGGVMEGAKLREVLALEAALTGAAGTHTYAIRAEPPVPGLGFSLALSTYVPWKSEPPSGGLELAIEPPKQSSVGEPAELAIAAAAPAGQPFSIDVGLPAGMTPDVPSLDALVEGGVVTSYARADGNVTLHVAARASGQSFSASIRAIPTLGGTLTSGPSRITLGTSTHWVPPVKWIVR